MKETVESIRVNAKFETVHENFRRFHAYCKGRGTDLTLTYCLMAQNWHEFGDYLLFADEWDCDVCVNLVRVPSQCSLYTLPVEELDRITTMLEKQGETLLPQLKRIETSGSTRSPDFVDALRIRGIRLERHLQRRLPSSCSTRQSSNPIPTG